MRLRPMRVEYDRLNSVFLACRGRNVSAAELCRKFKGNKSESTVRACIALLVKRKHLRRVSRGVYTATV